MITLTIKEKEYKVKFGYNSFCDTDLLEKTQDLVSVMNGNDATTNEDIALLGKLKDLFSCVRDLLFVGFDKYNPVESKKEIGDLLDDYLDEAPEGEDRGIASIFIMLTEELTNSGFMVGLMSQEEENTQTVEKKKVPQDHRAKAKK